MQIDILTLLKKPEAYPFDVKEIEVRETHISWVFIVNDLVYKVKKEIKLFDGILDFSSLELRKKYCEKELKLNKLMCPEIYLDVVAITESGISEGKTSPEKVVDWAVKMKRMPEEFLMKKMLQESKEIPLKRITEIAKTLAEFHSKCETRPEFGTMEKITRKIDENFETVMQHRDVNEDYMNRVHDFMKEKMPLFKERAENGKVVRFHGDVRPDNIVLAPEKVYIFDCIEFTDLFACGDVAEEIGFLSMDLDFWEKKRLASQIEEDYIKFSNDIRFNEVLNFYKSYRAFVLAKVNIFTELGAEDEQKKIEAKNLVEKYLKLAYSYKF